MRVIIEFDTDNAAFEDNWPDEIPYILGQAEGRLTDRGVDGTGWNDILRDSNGNTIGKVEVRS